MIKICQSCKKSFKTFPSRIGRFCSYACNNKMKPGTFRNGYIGLRGSAASNWRGGRAKHSDGYIWIHSPKHPHRDVRGYVLQHRLVMEIKVGRYLSSNEVVHHINGITDDNRPENLELMSQSEHCRLHFYKNNKQKNVAEKKA